MDRDSIGNLLLRVNDDLNRLQDNLQNRQSQDKLDVNEIKELLSSAQNGFHKRAEDLLTHINSQATSFTNLDQFIGGGISSAPSPITKDYLDRIQKIQFSQEREVPFLPAQHVSPGELLKRNMALRSIANPDSRLNRTYAHDKLGIQLPLIEKKRPLTVQPFDGIQKGSMVKKLERLPLEVSKHYNNQVPGRIMETDASKGLLNLIERGLIPPNAKITLDPPPINHEPVQLLVDGANKTRHAVPAATNDQGFSGGCYFLDETNANTTDYLNDDDENDVRRKRSKKNQIKSSEELYGESRFAQNKKKQFQNLDSNMLMDKTAINQNEATKKPILQYKKTRDRNDKKIKNLKFDEDVQDKSLLPVEPIEREETKPPATTPASMLSKSHMGAMHKFTIQDGKTRENTEEYLLFKRHYCLSWGGIVIIIKYLEELMQTYSIPIAFIDGDRAADLSVEFELEQKPTEEDLLTCVINKRDIWYLIRQPGRRFMGPHGQARAALVIQSKWRCYTARKEYLEYRRKRWAAGVIAIQWILHMKMSRVKLELKKTRDRQLVNFRKRFHNLALKWPSISSKRRVIIHLPSLGVSEQLRSKMARLPEMQNHQMARICDLKDPNVDVVYISPVLVNDELLQYYSKLFALKSAVDTGNSEDQKPLNTRYRIIVPEAIKSFPNHNMSLATLLKYSPRALNRIKSMICGRTAWLVPSVVSIDDLDVADKLDIPILGTEPAILKLCSSKSGIRKIFSSARVTMAPGEGDIQSMEQLQESLAQLITNNLSVRKWILKTNNDIYGQGLAYIEIEKHLSCYTWALKERQRYNEEWKKGWAQESAYNRILGEIPRIIEKHVIPNDHQKYPTGQKFLKEYFRQGGVIEGYPGSESVTNITVNMMIDPTGDIQILSSGDQIHDGNVLNAWGYSAPQSSIEAETLNSTCKKIADICKLKSIKGYFSIDFVTFVEGSEDNQCLWALDIDFRYSSMNSMINLAEFSSNFQFNSKDHLFEPIKENPHEKVSLNRYVCMSTNLSHSNLTMVHYSVFFQMCRAHGIGYDIKEKQGSIFSLIDSFNRENLGMITIGPSLEGTLENFAKNLHLLHQEISSPNMPGKGNFQSVIKEIESILGLVIENVVQSTTPISTK